jgi:hypothetical protein
VSDVVHPFPPRRELAHRRAGDADIYLLWSPASDSLAVTVIDPAGSFELVVSPSEALDAFRHPYAYAAQRGARPLETTAA